MLLVILVVCATVCAKPWHDKPATPLTFPAMTYSYASNPDYTTYEERGRHRHFLEEGRHHRHSEGDRYRWYPEEGSHRHSYGEERRHSYHEEDRYRPYHEEDRYRQLAKKRICSGDFLKKYDGVGPDARFRSKILSVTVQFEHENRTVSCTNNGHYHHHHHRHY